MKKGLLSQEMLKMVACVTMLADHIGAIFIPGAMWLRVVGRVSFPIYCFLIAEGVAHTRDAGKYGLRLLVGVVLAEIPYDLALHGGPGWEHQSVMLTLLLGFAAAMALRDGFGPGRLVLAALCVAGAEVLRADYGAMGVAMILLFSLTGRRRLIQTAGLILLGLDSVRIWGGIPIQMFAVAAMIPICLYSGKKRTASRAVQWGFYLFYPVHLAALYWLHVNQI